MLLISTYYNYTQFVVRFDYLEVREINRKGADSIFSFTNELPYPLEYSPNLEYNPNLYNKVMVMNNDIQPYAKVNTRLVFSFRTFNLSHLWILSQLSYERVLYV